ncbi:MAG TPA: glutathione synthase [Azonexus sp.]|nr:glutathione synthase [Azonexus sp.]
MKLGFVVDPLPELKAWKDSSVAMMRAAEARDHEVFAIDYATLGWRGGETGHAGGVFAMAARLQLRREASPLAGQTDDHAPSHRGTCYAAQEAPSGCDWYRAGDRQWQPLTDFDAVIMRKDPPFDFEYLTATWLLERAEATGLRVFNRPRALREHSEKVAISEFPQFIPTTLISRDPAQLQQFIDEHADVILKPLDGMGGSQVFRVRRDDPNRNVIIETLTCEGGRTIMAQRFVPEIAAGDKRILLIAGQPVPYCLARIPKTGETRGNLAAGGRGVAQELSPRDREIAEALGPILFARGLLLVGIDVIGDHLTEINVTSPTCMVEIRQQTGFDAATTFIAAIERECAIS